MTEELVSLTARDRRRIVHFSVTAQPTASWAAQQIREPFPWDTQGLGT